MTLVLVAVAKNIRIAVAEMPNRNSLIDLSQLIVKGYD